MLIFEPLDNCGELMAMEDFIDAVKCGALIDYDGFGYYALENKQSNKIIRPSDIRKGRILHGFTHVKWYNR